MEEEIEVLASDLANYAMRRADEDVRVAKYQAMTGRLMSSFVELNAAGRLCHAGAHGHPGRDV